MEQISEILIATRNNAKFEHYQRVMNYLKPDLKILN